MGEGAVHVFPEPALRRRIDWQGASDELGGGDVTAGMGLAGGLAGMTVLLCPPHRQRRRRPCTFKKHTLTITVHGQSANPAVVRQRQRLVVLDNAVTPLSCGRVTVKNTDPGRPMRFDASAGDGNAFVIDERQGRFEPGRTPETGGTSEIEFSVQAAAPARLAFLTVLGVTTEPNTFVAGSSGLGSSTAGALNLNGDADADVTFSSVDKLSLSGGWASDRLSGAGGSGTGAASLVPLFEGGECGLDERRGGHPDRRTRPRQLQRRPRRRHHRREGRRPRGDGLRRARQRHRAPGLRARRDVGRRDVTC